METFKNHPSVFFTIFAFVITYILGIGLYLGLDLSGIDLGIFSELVMKFGPSFAGILIIYIISGRKGLKDLLVRCTGFRINFLWYVFAVLMPPVVSGAVLYFSGYHTQVKSFNIFLILPVFLNQLLIAVFLGGGLGEELGWRGFLFPKLNERLSVLSASILTGLIWFAWHLPAYLFFNKGSDDPILPFLLLCISFSIIFSKIYYLSGKSLVIPILMHGSMNAVFYSMEKIFPEVLKSPGFQPSFDWYVAGIWAVIAVLFSVKASVTRN